MPHVHPAAWVHPGAQLADDVTVGPFAAIEAGAVIGPGTVVEAHVVIHAGARLGARNRISPNAVIGGPPQDLSFDGSPTGLVIGDDNQIREGATLHRSTDPDRPTRVGSGCLFMANAHVAHDCLVGDGVILTNNVSLGGHVQVEDLAVVGGGTQIHQHVRIGARAMVGGMSGVARDVIPFTFAFGILAVHYRLNAVGLRRAGIRGDRYKALEQALRRLRAREDLDGLPETEEILHLRRWMAAPSRRGRAPFAAPGVKAPR